MSNSQRSPHPASDDYSSTSEGSSCGGCLANYGASVFSALALAWFFYSYVLELVSDFHLEDELTNLECYATTVDWGNVAEALGFPRNYTVTKVDLQPYFTGTGYEVNGTYIPVAAMDCNMDTDLHYLNFFIVAAVINVICFAIIASCLTCYKFSLFANCSIDKQKEKAAARVDKALGIQQLSAVIFSITKIMVYVSVLNKLIYFGLWDDVNDFFKISDFDIPILFSAPAYYTIADRIKGDLAKTSFNIFRTYWFFQAIYFAHGEGCDVLKSSIRCLIVMFPATVLWTIKAVADIGIFHYTQRIYTDVGNFSVQFLMNIAIANVVFGALILLMVFYYNVVMIFVGPKKLKKYKNRNQCLSRCLFFFPMLFVIICFLGPIILWLQSNNHSSIYAALFYMAMIANGILTVVILVGLFKPTSYQNAIFCALGEREEDEDDGKSQNSMSPRDAEL